MSIRRRRFAFLLLISLASAPAALAALQLPSDLTAEATGPNGAIVTYSSSSTATGDDENGRPIGRVTCYPLSGSQFPLGTTTVSCNGNDGSTGSFQVTVVDTTPPSLSIPSDFTVPASSNAGAVVTYSASANDIVDGSVPVSCMPPSGSTFAVGTTTVTCSATDSHQNSISHAFAITVTAPQPPPPTPHEDVTVEATGPNGAVVRYNFGGEGDDENGRPLPDGSTCAPASGSTFPLGATLVQCTTGSFTVTVVDTTPPALDLPADVSSSNAIVEYTASATDLVDGSVAIGCTPPSGSTFPSGTTTVVCTASDSRVNAASGTFNVTVTDPPPPPEDTEAPVILSIVANPSVLTPPNKQMEAVVVTVEVLDNLDPSPLVRIFDVTADEAITSDDYEITGTLTIDLLKERDPHGNGRTYTLHIEAIDDSGNRSTGTIDVFVPHDSSGDSTASPAPKKRRASGPRG